MGKWNPAAIADRLHGAALDATLWPAVLAEISDAIGGGGALLISTEKRLEGTPYTPQLDVLRPGYIDEGWNQHDVRMRGVPIMMRRGVAIDHDYADAEDFEKLPFYRDFLGRHGYRWAAIVAAGVGNDLWALSVQRRIDQGPFSRTEADQLKALCKPLGEAARIAREIGFARILGFADALDYVEQPAVLLDDGGRVLAANASAELAGRELFVRRQSGLSFYDPGSQVRYEAALAVAVRADPNEHAQAPIVVDRVGRRMTLRAVTLRDFARYTFTGARVLVLLEKPKTRSEPPPLWSYGLTPAEARLAAALASGATLGDVADQLGIRYETARTRLKAVFLKMGVRRQAELVARLLRLGGAAESS